MWSDNFKLNSYSLLNGLVVEFNHFYNAFFLDPRKNWP